MQFEILKNTSTKPTDRHWQFCVGSGHALLAHRADYIQQLQFIHDELGIKRVRFHGIFNDDMKVVTNITQFLHLPGGDKFRDISFHQIGCVYDNILSTGMKPFVELSFMPSMMASGKKTASFGYKCNITLPKSFTEWGELIQAFVRYLIRRYGKDEVESWYFEVWNEPNLDVFFKGSMDDYFRLYETTVRAIKEVNPQIPVGGPSSAVSAWVPELVAYCEKNQVPLDFVSTHQYAGEPIGHVVSKSVIRKLILNGLQKMKKAKGGSVLEGVRMILRRAAERTDLPRGIFYDNAKVVKESAQSYPLFYTEWNVSATCSAPLNDTRMAASYAVKSVLDIAGIVDGSSIWSFSDIFEELFFFSNEFSGSFGLLTINGIPKPSFYALKMLSQVRETRLCLPRTNDDIEIGAFKDETGMQLLVYRQSHYPEGASAPVDISVDIDTRPAAVTIQRIDETHCNPYKVWQDMGMPEDLLPDQIEYIKEQSNMVEETLAYQYKNGRLRISADIGINDVWLIKIGY